MSFLIHAQRERACACVDFLGVPLLEFRRGPGSLYDFFVLPLAGQCRREDLKSALDVSAVFGILAVGASYGFAVVGLAESGDARGAFSRPTVLNYLTGWTPSA